MNALILTALLLPGFARAEKSGSSASSSLFKRVSSFLNGPAKHAPRAAAVMAVRGGIPTDQGEDLDQRLLDRARALRAALLRDRPETAYARALQAVHETLAASQYVQALSIDGAVEAKADAAKALSTWAAGPRRPPLPGAVKSLLTGPAAAIDDKALVAAGWGDYVRSLSPSDRRFPDAQPVWEVSEEVAQVDESLKSVRDSLLQRTLDAESQAKAHVLAGDLLRLLAASNMRGLAQATAASPIELAAPAAALDEGPAPAAGPDIPFDPKTIYQRVSKSVALIICSAAEGAGELGTGSVISAKNRLILTNAHVVIRDSTREPWPSIHVYFKPASMTGDPKRDMVDPVEGKVIAFDRALDLAVVEVERLPPSADAVALGDPRAVSVGDRVAAIGHPEQGGLWTLTTGVVSTLVANIGGVQGKDAFQTDTSINRGNSGGPLLNAAGHIVGVNTSMSRKAADGLAITSVNFSVRSDVARRWLASKGQQLAYGGSAAPATTVAAAAPTAPPPAAAPAPAATRASSPAKAEHVTITESKPFSRDEMIAAEIAKMEEFGEEMHQEIKRKMGQ